MTHIPDLVCTICHLIVENPVSLPCQSVICSAHMYDNDNDNFTITSITCGTCNLEYQVPANGFNPNEAIRSIVATNGHISEDKKELKNSLRDLNMELEQMYELVDSCRVDAEEACHKYFNNIKVNIVHHVDTLPQYNVGEFVKDLRDQTNIEEAKYVRKLAEIFARRVNLDFKLEKRRLVDLFRQPDLSVDNCNKVRSAQEDKISQMGEIIGEFDTVKNEYSSFEFRPFNNCSFGVLSRVHQQTLLATCGDKSVHIWDLESSECVRTLNATNQVNCLAMFDEHLVGCGTKAGLIMIWDVRDGVCIRKLNQIEVFEKIQNPI